MEHAVAETVKRFGRRDILVSNAGISLNGSGKSTPLADYMRLVMVNQVGCFLGMKAALPALRVQGGAIVNISSVSGMHASPGALGYGATKWAVRGMTKSAAREFAPYGIRVNSVHPSVIDTEMVTGEMRNSPWFQRVSTPAARAGVKPEKWQYGLIPGADASRLRLGSIDGGARLALRAGLVEDRPSSKC